MDASEEPEPIMLEEEDQDDLVAAILDANVGLREADTRRQAHIIALSVTSGKEPCAYIVLINGLSITSGKAACTGIVLRGSLQFVSVLRSLQHPLN